MGESLFLMVKSSYVSMGRKQRGYVAEPGTAGLSLDSHVPFARLLEDHVSPSKSSTIGS